MNQALVLIGAIAIWFACRVLTLRRRRASLPPGPKGLPFVGNIFDIPRERLWMVYRDWSLEFGSDVIFLQLPRQPTIILNSVRAVVDLMEKRSRNYSDKPILIMDSLTGWEWNIGTMPYGTQWRMTRRVFHQYFNQNAVVAYRPVQAREVYEFIKRASTFSGGVDNASLRQTFATIIFDIVYGLRITSKDDRYIVLARKASEGLSLARVPGAFWVEYFPLLKHIPSWVPGASARKWGERYRPDVLAMRNEPYDQVAKDMDSGTARPSIAQILIQKNQNIYAHTPMFEVHDTIARDVTGVAYAAAADTQSATVLCFLLAMLVAPSVQHKAQVELDNKTGPNRLPTMEDLASLPYIQAILWEVMRWAPVFPLGIPHRTIDDDEYNGYFIPKGTTVYGNVWAIFRDPKYYPNPETFNPDRFLRDGKINADVLRPDAFWGFGRRICPGRHLAIDTLSLLIACILHVYTIEPLPGEQLDVSFTTATLSIPQHVPCSFIPRNASASRLLLELEEGI